MPAAGAPAGSAVAGRFDRPSCWRRRWGWPPRAEESGTIRSCASPRPRPSRSASNCWRTRSSTRRASTSSTPSRVEPNSETGREGLLLAADALYRRGGYQSYVEAEQRYRDFLNRFPTSDQAAYAQFRLAGSLAERMEKPDRDQQTARQALTEFENVRRLYPTSQYAAEAAQRIVEVRNHLAEHEFVVGSFYYRFRTPTAAGNRFRNMLEEYPDYPEPDKILAHMCLTYRMVLEQIPSELGLDRFDYLKEACDRLRNEFPGSAWLKKAPSEEQLRKLRAKVPPTPLRPDAARRDGPPREDGPDN